MCHVLYHEHHAGLDGAAPELDRALGKVLFSYDALTKDLADEARVVFAAFCDGLKHATTKDLRTSTAPHA